MHRMYFSYIHTPLPTNALDYLHLFETVFLFLCLCEFAFGALHVSGILHYSAFHLVVFFSPKSHSCVLMSELHSPPWMNNVPL